MVKQFLRIDRLSSPCVVSDPAACETETVVGHRVAFRRISSVSAALSSRVVPLFYSSFFIHTGAVRNQTNVAASIRFFTVSSSVMESVINSMGGAITSAKEAKPIYIVIFFMIVPGYD